MVNTSTILLALSAFGVVLVVMVILANISRRKVHIIKKIGWSEILLYIMDGQYVFGATIPYKDETELKIRMLQLRSNICEAMKIDEPLILTNSLNGKTQAIPPWSFHEIIDAIDLMLESESATSDRPPIVELIMNGESIEMPEKGMIEVGGIGKNIRFNADFMERLGSKENIPGASNGPGRLLLYGDDGSPKDIIMLPGEVVFRQVEGGLVTRLWQFASAQELLIKCNRAGKSYDRATS